MVVITSGRGGGGGWGGGGYSTRMFIGRGAWLVVLTVGEILSELFPSKLGLPQNQARNVEFPVLSSCGTVCFGLSTF